MNVDRVIHALVRIGAASVDASARSVASTRPSGCLFGHASIPIVAVCRLVRNASNPASSGMHGPSPEGFTHGRAGWWVEAHSARCRSASPDSEFGPRLHGGVAFCTVVLLYRV